MKILLIEDSRFLRLAIDKILTKIGHEVTGVADGRDGLRLAHSNSPDVIVLDMMLPGLDGTNVLKELKKDPATADVPVVVLTSLSSLNADKLKAQGAAAYFEKAKLNLEENSEVLIQVVEQAGSLKLAAQASSGR